MSDEFDANTIAAKYLAERTDTVLAAVVAPGRRMITKAATALLPLLSDYVNAVWKKYSHCRSFFYRVDPVPFYSFYIPSGLESHGVKIEEADATKVLAHCAHTIITGSGGSGKSMLLRHLLLTSLKNTPYIPLFLELRQLNQTDDTFDDLCVRVARDCGLPLRSDGLPEAFKQGIFALFVDGFDELDLSHRDVTTSRLRELAAQFPRTPIILTSRPDDALAAWMEFRTLSVAPLSLDECLKHIDLSPIADSVKRQFANELRMGRFKAHLSFLSNPLLLSIMIMTYHESADIPNKLSVFFGLAFEALFHKHDAWKGAFRRQRACALNILDFERVFACFSLLLFLGRRIAFTRAKAIETLEEVARLTLVKFEADAFLKDATQAVCLLVEDGLQLTYAHRSFQEFFAAKCIADASPSAKLQFLNSISHTARSDLVMALLHELQPEFVEIHYVLPRIEKVFPSIGMKRSPASRYVHLRHLKKRYDEFALEMDDKQLSGSYSEEPGKAKRFDWDPDATYFAIHHCSYLVNCSPRLAPKIAGESRETINELLSNGPVKTRGMTTRTPLARWLYSYGGWFGAAYLDRLYAIAEAIRERRARSEEIGSVIFNARFRSGKSPPQARPGEVP